MRMERRRLLLVTDLPAPDLSRSKCSLSLPPASGTPHPTTAPKSGITTVVLGHSLGLSSGCEWLQSDACSCP